MDDNSTNSDILLSFALFKTLYDENQSIYGVISLLIRFALSKSNSREFSLVEITKNVNEQYKFDIPEAIIKTSLNKLKNKNELKLENKKYLKTNKFENIESIAKDTGAAKRKEAYIITEISKYLKAEYKQLSFEEVRNSLEEYILNKSNGTDISTHISTCIIKNTQNTNFINGLNEIKQGIILYKSISYGIEEINTDKWNKKTIFLSAEILFYINAYNGFLFNKMSNDFLDLIRIVNTNKRVIDLRFSVEAKKQIDGIFNVAESIIEKKQDYKINEAVNYILKKCSSASDVVNLKSDFYEALRKYKIKEYSIKENYYKKTNHQYNLGSNNNLDDKEEIHLKQLNNISILRQGNKNITLDKVEFLFLTQTRNTIYLSIENKDKKDFPLAISLFDLTNQLWIKTNMGLGKSDLPSTFDIRNNAKIALSSSFAKKVLDENDKIQESYKNQKTNADKNIIIEKIADLRKMDITPDNINQTTCEEINNFIIDPHSIERHYEEKAMYKTESENKDEIIEQQNKKIQKLEQDDVKKKLKNKKMLKGVGYIILAMILIYFYKELIVFFGDFSWFVDIIIVISSIISIINFIPNILRFLGIDMNKIKTYFNK